MLGRWLEISLLEEILPFAFELPNEHLGELVSSLDGSQLLFDLLHISCDTAFDGANSQLFDVDGLDVLHEVVEVVVPNFELVVLGLGVVRQNGELLRDNEVRVLAV